MCGIVGFAGAGDRSVIERMMHAVAHRGPDAAGRYHDAEIAVHLGHRRLSILDLAGGAQPMANAARTIFVTYNGEIYNHGELRAELEAQGYRFQSSHSDTEVLVHGYAAWGADLPRRLNGMFAFAILDRVRRRLFLARDRFGEKPLYYVRRREAFAFASEIQALQCHPAIKPPISIPGLQKYFAHGFFPGDHTLYDGVSQLPAGHWMTVALDGLDVVRRRYWGFDIEPDEDLAQRGEEALAEELRHLFAQAVQRRLISDVPLGILLSGGVDSSGVLAMAAAHMPAQRLRTFTIGFNEPSFDESRFARQVADRVGSEHHVEMLSLGQAKGLIASLLPRMGEPLADASLLPTYLLSEFTRRHVTVALSGDGGDELFAGYDPFKALAPAHVYERLVPRPLHRAARRLADLLPISAANMAFDFKLRRTLQGLSLRWPLWPPAWMAPLEPDAIGDLFASQVTAEELYSEVLALAEHNHHKHPVDQMLEYFTSFYLPSDILTKVDRAAMRVGLETRAVMLDNDLVSFCERLPHRFKFRNGRGKYLLRKALARDLDAAILDRPKKGFGIPLAQWLRELEPPDCAWSALGLNGQAIDRAFAEHRSLRRDHRLFLWAATSLAATTEQPVPSEVTAAPLAPVLADDERALVS
jgi:asparagine synthase (glutamine-hydrolysing)